jgi:hypothetical protein
MASSSSSARGQRRRRRRLSKQFLADAIPLQTRKKIFDKKCQMIRGARRPTPDPQAAECHVTDRRVINFHFTESHTFHNVDQSNCRYYKMLTRQIVDLPKCRPVKL